MAADQQALKKYYAIKRSVSSGCLSDLCLTNDARTIGLFNSPYYESVVSLWCWHDHLSTIGTPKKIACAICTFMCLVNDDLYGTSTPTRPRPNTSLVRHPRDHSCLELVTKVRPRLEDRRSRCIQHIRISLYNLLLASTPVECGHECLHLRQQLSCHRCFPLDVSRHSPSVCGEGEARTIICISTDHRPSWCCVAVGMSAMYHSLNIVVSQYPLHVRRLVNWGTQSGIPDSRPTSGPRPGRSSHCSLSSIPLIRLGSNGGVSPPDS